MKKKIAALAIILSMISIAAMGTLAYFTDSAIAHNVITTGLADILIEEYQITADGTLEPYPTAEPIKIMPGEKVSKIVTIRSLEQSSYIRARYEVIIKDSSGKQLPVKDGMIKIVPDTQFWNTKENDKWFYYYKDISDKEATEPLFREVQFDGPSMTNEYRNGTVEVHVYAQAVQSANNGTSALTAENWPNKNKEQGEAVNE